MFHDKRIWLALLLIVFLGAGWRSRLGWQPPAPKARGPQVVLDAAAYGFTPENQWKPDFDAGAALNQLFDDLGSPGIVTNVAGTYYFKTPVRWIDKRVRCEALCDLIWNGGDDATLFTFGGSAGHPTAATDSHLSGMRLCGGEKYKKLTAWRFQNCTDCLFENLRATLCNQAFMQWADNADQDFAYFNLYLKCKANYCRSVVLIDGAGGSKFCQQSSTAQFMFLDASGSGGDGFNVETVFDLREGANACLAIGTTLHSGAANPIIVRTGKSGGSNRIEMAYYESPGRGVVEFNNDQNRFYCVDPYQVIDYRDRGHGNRLTWP